MRTLYDGINSLAAGIHALDSAPDMIAGYVDGRYAWTASDWALFPHSVQVKIAVSASDNEGDVIDCETGDATPEEAAGWVRRRKAAGLYRPTVYCNKSTVSAVREATGTLVAGKDYDFWVADWTGSAHEVTLPGPGASAKAAAVQYKSTNSYDESAVYDDGWPHRTASSAPPKAPAKPAPAGADLWPAGVTLRQGSQGNPVWALQYALRDCGIAGARGLKPDGDFGPDTAGAVRAIEEALNIPNSKLANGDWDGIAGPAVRSSLISHGYMTSAGEGK